MPANDLSDDETWEVISFLRSIQPRSSTVIAGNASIGEQYFSTYGHCSSCHMVRGKGGRLGPDLSRVGAARSIDYIVESIREPSKQLSDGMLEPGHDFPIAYDAVTVTLDDGRTIIGVAKNEDTFSIQMIDLSGELRLLSKTDASSVVHERRSLMPTYGKDSLSDQSLWDLLAYLETLRGQ
jgi:putative heme-binding domain-containing protein